MIKMIMCLYVCSIRFVQLPDFNGFVRLRKVRRFFFRLKKKISLNLNF